MTKDTKELILNLLEEALRSYPEDVKQIEKAMREVVDQQ